MNIYIEKWPIAVMRYKGDSTFTPFETYRADLKPPSAYLKKKQELP